MRAVQINEFGGPEVLTFLDLPDPVATEGMVVLDVTSAGVNYYDTNMVEDSYLSRTTLPLVPGGEVVGTLPDGRRVCAFAMSGGYAQKAVVSPDAVFPLPDGVTDGQALSLMVQGLTAWHLLRTSTHLMKGESVVVHAAAGGVGTLAVQLAKAWGAGTVIGVASTQDKRDLCLSLGADVAVDSRDADMQSALEQANGGKKVDIVLEMVGGPTFDASLAALAPFGRLATFGIASLTAPKAIEPVTLMSEGRGVIGFWLRHCMTRPEMLGPPMAELLSMVEAGALTPVVGGTYPLSGAHRAHEALRSRASHGKLILDARS